MSSVRHPWAVVVFAARESLFTLRRTLDAAARAATQCANLDVLINGAPQLAKELLDNLQARPLDRPAGLTLRIWSIPLGDKANAWNQYIHHLWAGQELVFFIDGYVRLNSDAIELLGGAVQSDPQALGGSGVPTVGRSARALRHRFWRLKVWLYWVLSGFKALVGSIQ